MAERDCVSQSESSNAEITSTSPDFQEKIESDKIEGSSNEDRIYFYESPASPVGDVEEDLSNREEYRSRGQPWLASYLRTVPSGSEEISSSSHGYSLPKAEIAKEEGENTIARETYNLADGSLGNRACGQAAAKADKAQSEHLASREVISEFKSKAEANNEIEPENEANNELEAGNEAQHNVDNDEIGLIVHLSTISDAQSHPNASNSPNQEYHGNSTILDIQMRKSDKQEMIHSDNGFRSQQYIGTGQESFDGAIFVPLQNDCNISEPQLHILPEHGINLPAEDGFTIDTVGAYEELSIETSDDTTRDNPIKVVIEMEEEKFTLHRTATYEMSKYFDEKAISALYAGLRNSTVPDRDYMTISNDVYEFDQEWNDAVAKRAVDRVDAEIAVQKRAAAIAEMCAAARKEAKTVAKRARAAAKRSVAKRTPKSAAKAISKRRAANCTLAARLAARAVVKHAAKTANKVPETRSIAKSAAAVKHANTANNAIAATEIAANKGAESAVDNSAAVLDTILAGAYEYAAAGLATVSAFDSANDNEVLRRFRNTNVGLCFKDAVRRATNSTQLDSENEDEEQFFIHVSDTDDSNNGYVDEDLIQQIDYNDFEMEADDSDYVGGDFDSEDNVGSESNSEDDSEFAYIYEIQKVTPNTVRGT